ncbi:MAG: hypothetical protein H7Y03_14250 [Chitinophagaceae bacterium]|nr:hypothetical protein [Chitinophagaceae bacterium]
MRLLLLSIVFLVSLSSLKAQMPCFPGISNYAQRSMMAPYYQQADSNSLTKRWSLVKYASLSTSFAFFNGGSATILSAPVGLQLNYRLTDNFYAFAAASVAPAYINFNNSFRNAGSDKYYRANNLSSSNNFGMSSRAEVGIMYINDRKTFAISGSIGIERNTYPIIYPPGRPQQQPAPYAR